MEKKMDILITLVMENIKKFFDLHAEKRATARVEASEAAKKDQTALDATKRKAVLANNSGNKKKRTAGKQGGATEKPRGPKKAKVTKKAGAAAEKPKVRVYYHGASFLRVPSHPLD
jgi:hypothetical protein